MDGLLVYLINNKHTWGALTPMCVFLCVSGMAHFLLVKVQSRVVTAKCSEPQAVNSNVNGGVSGVAKLLGLRTET